MDESTFADAVFRSSGMRFGRAVISRELLFVGPYAATCYRLTDSYDNPNYWMDCFKHTVEYVDSIHNGTPPLVRPTELGLVYAMPREDFDRMMKERYGAQ